MSNVQNKRFTSAMLIAFSLATPMLHSSVASAASLTCRLYTGENQTGSSSAAIAISCNAPSDSVEECNASNGLDLGPDFENNIGSAEMDLDAGNDEYLEPRLNIFRLSGQSELMRNYDFGTIDAADDLEFSTSDGLFNIARGNEVSSWNCKLTARDG